MFRFVEFQNFELRLCNHTSEFKESIKNYDESLKPNVLDVTQVIWEVRFRCSGQKSSVREIRGVKLNSICTIFSRRELSIYRNMCFMQLRKSVLKSEHFSVKKCYDRNMITTENTKIKEKTPVIYNHPEITNLTLVIIDQTGRFLSRPLTGLRIISYQVGGRGMIWSLWPLREPGINQRWKMFRGIPSYKGCSGNWGTEIGI